MNWWTYAVLLDENPTDSATALTRHLVAAGLSWRPKWALDVHGEEVVVRESLEETLHLLGELGGGGTTIWARDDAIGLDFDVSRRTVGISSPASLRTGVEGESVDLLLRTAFRWLCEKSGARYGSSEDLYATENIWHQYGVSRLDSVWTVEREDLQRGVVPEVVPWLSYFDTRLFPLARALFSDVEGANVESVGSSGILVRLADWPWEGAFAVRTGQGYVVVDAYGRNESGRRNQPIGLNRILDEAKRSAHP